MERHGGLAAVSPCRKRRQRGIGSCRRCVDGACFYQQAGPRRIGRLQGHGSVAKRLCRSISTMTRAVSLAFAAGKGQAEAQSVFEVVLSGTVTVLFETPHSVTLSRQD